MTTLKEIAALFRLYVDEIAKVRVDQIEQHPYLPEAQEAADQLEALAGAEPVAAQEPILWVHPMMLNANTLGVECSPMRLAPAQIPLYAAPQRMTVEHWDEHMRVVAEKNRLQSDLAAAQARVKELHCALTNLYALVQGECPSLLENDHHDEMVRKALTGDGL